MRNAATSTDVPQPCPGRRLPGPLHRSSPCPFPETGQRTKSSPRCDTHDFEQDVAGGEGFTLSFFPGSDAALGHRRRHGWHLKVGNGMTDGGLVQAFALGRH